MKRKRDHFNPYVAYTVPLKSKVVMPGHKIGKIIITNTTPKNGLAKRKLFIYLPFGIMMLWTKNILCFICRMTRMFLILRLPISVEGNRYVDFVANEVKPLIDQNFRTIKEDSGIAGSSFGAGVSIYIWLKHRDKFRYVGDSSSCSLFGVLSDEISNTIYKIFIAFEYDSGYLFSV